MKKYRTVWMAILQWGLLWSLILGCSLAWNTHQVKRQAEEFARHEATSVIQKDLAFRRWVTMHGGVYVHPTLNTPPNPWLTVPKRDITATDGDHLTLMNPAYVTRQVMALYDEQFGVKGHITSQHLKNPANAPDAWEKTALQRFDRGDKEVRELTTINGAPYYRLILPMRMEQGCLKCHADTKVPVGNIRGGISAAVPLTPYLTAAAYGLRTIRLAHGAIWLVGMFGIAGASVVYHRQQQRNRRAEEELRAQEALYASLTTASPTGVFQTDLAGSCCYVNQRWSDITGLPFEAALGDGWISMLHPDDQQAVHAAWQRAVTEKQPFCLEYRCKRPDGSICWVYGQSAEIFNENGEVIGHVGTITDISRQKEGETRLAEQSLFLRESQAIAKVGGWKCNPLTGMLAWTDEIYQLLEHPRQEPLEPERCFCYFDPQDHLRVRQALDEAFTQGSPFQLSCRMISHSGRSFWADLRCIGRLEASDGTYITGTLQDVTEYKQIEELLTSAKESADAANRMKTELLATVSHELRTPLNGVMGAIQLMETTTLDQEQHGYLQMARQSADSELLLVNDLLDLAGLEASGTQISSAQFCLMDCLQLAINQHRCSIEERKLTFITHLPDTLRTNAIIDGRRLTQIVGNLLGNAVKFTEQGHIELSASLEGEYGSGQLRVSISDSGIGIAPHDLERIFEPFVQVDMSNTRKFGGTGLGLAICRRLAEKMGGSITVSSSPGEGSCFTLTLPVTLAAGQQQHTAAVSPAASPAALWQGPDLTVLIAEDNETNLRAAAGLLQKLGMKTICAQDGKLALGHWLQGNIDLILMDIQMPVMDGREATRFIRQREQDSDIRTPIIALTAHAMSGDREQFLAEGFDGYVAKPFQLAELTTELARVLRP